ncbi:hypothetical protein BAY61_32360 (plasmid) [Prauserella marina]|uniref:Uncharacterized protein n=1 Tax=Prauserella marina TaxID=530584 RepID=A0A222W1F8_9PSEU|nr:hypothetical protein [Prauserella marina]ASR39975.1 hypothetical protein BAY61_32360 [Prauserella marina]PWV71314.1 hypothetical protein DES30_11230 [Prauserella marina]SDD96736.1 hypothetical protein SAMN05421630_11582 [Prauserella marina]
MFKNRRPQQPQWLSEPYRNYHSDGSGLPPDTADGLKQMALYLLDRAGRGETTENDINAAGVLIQIALLTHLQEQEKRNRVELEQRDAEFRELVTPKRPPARVRVFHNTRHSAMGFGYVDTDSFVEVYAYDEPVVEPDTSDEQIAERAFTLFNIGDDPDYGEPDHRAVEYCDRRNRPLSKGDALAIDGRFYVCAANGWTPIAMPQLTVAGQHGSTPLYGPHARA